MKSTRVVCGSFLLLALALSGCSKGGAEGGGAQGTGGGGEKASLSDAQTAELQAKIDKYKKLPELPPHGDPFDAKKAAGKTIMTIPSSSALEFCHQVDLELARVAAEYGVKAVEYENQGQPNQWVAGMNAAANSGANLVNIACGTDPSVLSPQTAQLKSAGIPVVAAHNYDPTKKELAPDLAGIVNAQYKTVGELQADWVILQTKGRANVLAIDDIGSDIATPELVSGINQEFAKYCPQTCKVRHVSVPIPNWSTAISPVVAAELSRNPDLNYIIGVYDDMVKYILAPLTSAGATGRVKIATFNASPSVVKMIQEGDVVTFEVGEDSNGLARAIFDQDARVLLGMPPSKQSYAALRIFDKSNAKEAGTPPKFTNGYGNAAADGYKKLWSGTSP